MPRSRVRSLTAPRAQDSLTSFHRQIGPEDREWRRSLPRITAVRRGEALSSVLLRLEELNHLPAGALVARLRTYGSGAIEPKMLTGTCIDLDLLCEDAGDLPLEEVVATTLRSALDWQFSRGVARGPSLYHQIHVVCPACAAARVFLLSAVAVPIRACPRHGLSLRSRCTCGARFDIFGRQRPFTCQACGRDYAALPRAFALPSLIVTARRRAHAFMTLLSLTEPLNSIGRRAITSRLAELLRARGASDYTIRLAAARHAAPIGWVVLTLEQAGARPRDLVSQETPTARRRRAIA